MAKAVQSHSTSPSPKHETARSRNFIKKWYVIWGLDNVLNLVHELDERGCSLQVLEPAIDTGGPMGKVMLTVLGMVSEMELGFIKERRGAGIEKAKAEGKYKGRPTSLDHDKIKAMMAEGMGATAIARELGCNRGAIYKVLKA